MSESLFGLHRPEDRGARSLSVAATPGTAKILVVDDRPANLFALERALAPLQAEVFTATSGPAALGLMLRHQFAVVLLDVQMPEMDGFETATLMREHPDTRSVPVIFVTAISSEQRWVKAGYKAGAVDYLLKPIDPDVLLSKVQVFLDLDLQRSGLRQALSTIRRISHRQKLILNCAAEGILGLNADGNVVFSNPAAERLLKMSEAELCGVAVRDIVGDSSMLAAERESLMEVIRQRGSVRGEDSVFHCFDGSTMPVDFSCAAIVDDDLDYSGGVLIFNDITERKNSEQQLMRLARYDELTGLANRTLFREFLRKSMARARRRDRLMSLLFLDLDRFKSINDELGHSAGDMLLRSVAGRLLRVVREGDLVARLGGDEFAIVLDEVDAPESVGGIAEKILIELSRPHETGERLVVAHGSIGISLYSGGNETADALIRKADTAMYEAKRRGRNGYRYFSDSMNDHAMRGRLLEADLAAAIEQRRIEVQYQAQFHAGHGGLLGFEALARWYDEKRGLISPDEFIPIAEGAGLIESLGHYVMERACWQLGRWQRAGLVDADCRISVNVSVMQLHSGRLVPMVQDCLQRAALDPRNLTIELTESTVMDDAQRAVEQLGQLNALGIRVAIDDFGTGYSSLSYLQRLPIDTLKIDKTFVHGIGTSDGNEAIMHSIVALAKSLSLDVVAEGVETDAQRNFLETLGCHALQGFLLAHPATADDIERALRAPRDGGAAAPA